jgi:hypothetical protein
MMECPNRLLEAWKEDVTPWDAAGSQPALVELLEKAPDDLLPTDGIALVPGSSDRPVGTFDSCYPV